MPRDGRAGSERPGGARAAEEVGGDRAADQVREGRQAPRAHRHRRAGLEDPQHVQEPLGAPEVEHEQRRAGADRADRHLAGDGGRPVIARHVARQPDEGRPGGDAAEPEVQRHLPRPHRRARDRAHDGNGDLLAAAGRAGGGRDRAVAAGPERCSACPCRRGRTSARRLNPPRNSATPAPSTARRQRAGSPRTPTAGVRSRPPTRRASRRRITSSGAGPWPWLIAGPCGGAPRA